MLENRPKITSRARLYLLGGFLVVILMCYVCVLYSTQIVHGAEYLEQSVRTITTQQTVEASRGVITDRNGTVLVSNRQTYNLTFDPDLLKSGDDENACILRALELCRQQTLTWQDNLPLSKTAPWTYAYGGASVTQQTRFVTFLSKRMGLLSADASYKDVTEQSLADAGLTADVLFSAMRKEFAIPADWSDTDARDVLGVLYELSIRELVNTTAYVMAEDVSTSLISLLNDGDYRGVAVVSASAREYNTSYAAHILGVVGKIDDYTDTLRDQGYARDDSIGKTGVESAFESYLKGTDGKRIVSTNAEGRITSELYSVEPDPGDTVELTLDLDLQKVTEDTLAETVSAMSAKDGITDRGAGAVVIEVGTGDVLALASYPTYDPAAYYTSWSELSADPAKPLFNRATSGTYAPGSTFKPCTAVAALEEGKVSTTEKINDTGTWYYPGASTGDYAKCWNHAGHGRLNVTQAITNSCNYFFAEMGYRLGLKTLNEYASAFGLGQHTGIEIGDKAGMLAEGVGAQDLAPWAAFGQANYLFTPLQLSNYIATLVSGGKRYEAHLLHAVKTADNTRTVYTESAEPVNDMAISDSTLNAVKKGMHDLTTVGALAPYFKDCVVEAGAKTGTAQVSSQKVNNGVFVCFAPYDDPEIAVAIAIEQGGTGAALASTAVTILNAYFTADQIGAAVITGENQLLQ